MSSGTRDTQNKDCLPETNESQPTKSDNILTIEMCSAIDSELKCNSALTLLPWHVARWY